MYHSNTEKNTLKKIDDRKRKKYKILLYLVNRKIKLKIIKN